MQVAIEVAVVVCKRAQVSPVLVRAQLNDHLMMVMLQQIEVSLLVLLLPRLKQLAVRRVHAQVHTRIEVHDQNETLAGIVELRLEPVQLSVRALARLRRCHVFTEGNRVQANEADAVCELYTIIAARHVRIFDTVGYLSISRYIFKEHFVCFREVLAGLEVTGRRIVRRIVMQVKVVVALCEQYGDTLQVLLKEVRDRLKAAIYLVDDCGRDILLMFLWYSMTHEVTIEHYQVEWLALCLLSHKLEHSIDEGHGRVAAQSSK